MICDPTLRQRLEDRLAKKQASLELAYSTYDTLLQQEVEEYRFDSGEGSQSAKRRKVNDLKSQIDSLESEIDSIYRKLYGCGIVAMNVRRRR